jgi:hypothetical protein
MVQGNDRPITISCSNCEDQIECWKATRNALDLLVTWAGDDVEKLKQALDRVRAGLIHMIDQLEKTQ